MPYLGILKLEFLKTVVIIDVTTSDIFLKNATFCVKPKKIKIVTKIFHIRVFLR